MKKEEIKKKLEELADTNLNETIRLRGELIKILKDEIKKSNNPAVQSTLKLELKHELEQHKEIIKKMGRDKTYSLPERVGLKVKEIATTINLFLNKSDIINKAKQVLTGTVASSIVTTFLTIGINALTGGGVTLATITGLVPTFAYIGLSNVLRQMITKTPYQSLVNLDENKDKIFEEASKFGKECILENKQFLDLLVAKSNEHDNNKLILVNEKLIVAYKDIIKKAPNDNIRQSLQMELINVMQDLKKCYEKKKRNYVKDKEEMTALEFAKLEKDYLALCADLTNVESFFADASKFALKNIGINTVTMYVARLILSSCFPSLAFNNLKDAITPFFLTVINNLTNMGEFKNHIKVKSSKYTDTLIKFNKPELFRELTQEKGMALA